MTYETIRSLERLHAVVAWAATAALVAAAAAFARGDRGRRAAARLGAAAAALCVCASLLGIELHDPYRGKLRQRLFMASPSLGWLFERKLPLAFGATLLSVGALAAVVLLRRAEARGGDAGLVRDLRRAAAVGWTAAAVWAVIASVASAVVARRAFF